MSEFQRIKGKTIHPSFRKRSINRTRTKKKQISKVAVTKLEFSPSRKLTLFKDNFDAKDFTLQTKPLLYQTNRLTSPSVIDYTNEMSPVKDQKNLGSCVSFAVAAMKEWQERKEHELEVKEGKRDHRKNKIYDYSEQWIYWNCKKIDQWPNEEGTSIRCGMQVLNKIGVPTEKGWVYTDDKINIGEPKKWASLIAKWALAGTYYRVGNSSQAKIALIEDGPFVMGIPCFYDFFFVGRDGVVPDPADGENHYGGHALCVVGVDDNKKLIKFKNSWSNSWGQNGYGYISYNYFNKYSWDNWACKDISVTKEMLKGARSL